MDFTKVVGWLLLSAGIIIIIYTLYSSYNIFTGQTDAPEIFEIEKQESLVQGSGIQDIQAQMQEMFNEQLKGFIPADTLPKILNLSIWTMLAGLLIFGGSQISNLGIKLVKK